MSLDEKERRAIRPDAQLFDEIRLITIPRYKTSGLSGDEWRISVRIEFLRKGKIIAEEWRTNMEYATKHLGMIYDQQLESGNCNFQGIDDMCDQEGCNKKATVKYYLKKEWCDRCGQPTPIFSCRVYRLFCDEHKVRGDCALEDADRNYEQ